MYRVSVHEGPAAFLERAEAWLLEREDLNNLILSLAYARASGAAPAEAEALFATVEEGDRVLGCVVRTPPHKVLVTDMPPDTAPIVAGALAQRYESIPAVLGPEPVASAVARSWVGLRGGRTRPGMRQRIYRLDSVSPPSGVPGRLRVAAPEDIDLAADWGRRFAEDTGVAFERRREVVGRWVERGVLFLWQVDGTPCSIAVASGQTPRGVRVGYVYTPPELRRSGYASACVAALSQRLLDDGFGFCVLYTDLGNPTSNAIYRRVGYVPLADVMDVDVVPPEVE